MDKASGRVGPKEAHHFYNLSLKSFFINMYSKKPTVFSMAGLGRGTFLPFASFYYPLVDRFFCFLSFGKIKWKEARVTI